MTANGEDMLRVRIIEEANVAELPPPELADQLWEKLAARLGETTLEPAREALPAHAAHGVTGLFARKWLASAVACSVLAGGGAALWAYSRPSRPASAEAVSALQPSIAAPAQPAQPAGHVQPLAPQRELDDLSEETRLLGDAQQALSRGAPEQSLRLLSEHAARFPVGVLAPERDAARVFTLCALGRQSEARKERQRFIRTWPDSPLGALVRARCADSSRRQQAP